MALTRKLLKTMGLEDEVIEQIITAHAETVEALKEEGEKAKQSMADYDNLKNELETLKKEDYKAKFEALEKEFEGYKTDAEKAKVREGKLAAYRSLLKRIGLGDKQIAKIAELKNLDELELDSEGRIVGEADLEKTEKEDWGAFIVSTQSKHTEDPEDPHEPNNEPLDVSQMSMAEYIKNRKEGKI